MNAIESTFERPVAEVEGALREALAVEGFGILTEIDVAATLRAKLGVERPSMKILGACNPTLAHRALELDASISLLLPCNVVVEAADEGRTRVSIADPRELLTIGATASGEELSALADDAAHRLTRALAAVTMERATRSSG